jgi:uncharacterized protein YjlB
MRRCTGPVSKSVRRRTLHSFHAQVPPPSMVRLASWYALRAFPRLQSKPIRSSASVGAGDRGLPPAAPTPLHSSVFDHCPRRARSNEKKDVSSVPTRTAQRTLEAREHDGSARYWRHVANDLGGVCSHRCRAPLERSLAADHLHQRGDCDREEQGDSQPGAHKVPPPTAPQADNNAVRFGGFRTICSAGLPTSPRVAERCLHCFRLLSMATHETLEGVKHALEYMTRIGRPSRAEVEERVRRRKANLHRFKDDGATPNNAHCPLVHYKSVLNLDDARDPAAIFERLFASNQWRHSWRDGIYSYNHFHTRTHEVLGVARGSATVQFGGSTGKLIDVKAGDVICIPAGVGHRRRKATRDLLVVGAYPVYGQYDEPRPSEVDHDQALAATLRVKPPLTDPVYGKSGPLVDLWRPELRQ